MSPTFDASAGLRRDLARWRTPALIGGLVLLVISFAAALFVPGDFFHGYLIGFLFWTGITLGSMAFLMTQYLTAGAWGIVTRRIFEAATRTLPLMAVLFIPLAFGLPSLYEWARPDRVRVDELLQHRSGYMNTPLFLLRAAGYFAIWIAIAYFLNLWSRQQDEGVPGRGRQLERLSAPGLIVYSFTITFATVDWAASLHTHWFSTMWGFLFIASEGLAAIAFVIAAATLLSRTEPMRAVLRASHFHDLGKLLLMMVMIWAYFSFSQLLIVWAGNLSDEIPWYLPRFKTSWGWVGVALILFQFVVPFLLLLSRPLKRRPLLLSGVVAVVLVMRYVDLVWIVMPSYRESGVSLGWLDFAAPVGLGGVWLWAFLGQLPKLPLLPVNAPLLEEALVHGED